MLQFAINHSYSKTRRPPDFLAKNRRAVRNMKPKLPSQANKKPHPLNGKPQQPTRSKAAANAGDTVVISKSYLDSLLRMSQVDAHGNKEKGTHVHVDVEASEVPGLQASPDKEPHLQQSLCNEDPMKPLSPSSPNHQSNLPHSNTVTHHHNTQSNTKVTNDATPEEYFPFGRPGCGAPLRTVSGHVIADLRKRSRVAVSSDRHLPADGNLGSMARPAAGRHGDARTVMEGVGVELASPRYARGAGPHVNEYVLKEKEGKRKQELEHLAYLKAQIAAKEQAKKDAMERTKREEEKEEARLIKERRKLEVDYHREIEMARWKEEASRQRQVLIQEAVDKAAEEAKKARQASKKHHHTTHHSISPSNTSMPHMHQPPPISHSTLSPSYTTGHQNVDFDLRNTHILETSPSKLTTNLHSPSKFNTVLRSPSMLQLSDLIHQFSPQSDTPAQRRTEPKSVSGVKGSRIPVRKRHITKRLNTSDENGILYRGLVGKDLVDSPSSDRKPHPASTRTAGSQNDNMLPLLETEATNVPVFRTSSPPVPALAHKIRKGLILSNSETNASGKGESTVQMVTREGISPPVPALRKKQAKDDLLASNGTRSSSHGINTRATAPTNPTSRLPPVVMGTGEITNSSSHLLPVVTETTKMTHDSVQPLQHRQQVILRELAELRKGLLSHQSTIDHKLGYLLHNNLLVHHQKHCFQ